MKTETEARQEREYCAEVVYAGTPDVGHPRSVRVCRGIAVIRSRKGLRSLSCVGAVVTAPRIIAPAPHALCDACAEHGTSTQAASLVRVDNETDRTLCAEHIAASEAIESIMQWLVHFAACAQCSRRGYHAAWCPTQGGPGSSLALSAVCEWLASWLHKECSLCGEPSASLYESSGMHVCQSCLVASLRESPFDVRNIVTCGRAVECDDYEDDVNRPVRVVYWPIH